MRKLLQILAVVLLVLSIAALVLGIQLFGKRELLKGRAQALEKGMVQVAALLEQPTDPDQTPANFTEKDIGEVTAEPVAEPQLGSFWKDYPSYLEEVDRPLFSVKRDELMNFYKVNQLTGKPEKNAATGLYVTEGDGTMDATIKRVSEAATKELEVLNNTRHQLRRLREELVTTIGEVNDGKQRQRQQLAQIAEQKTTIAGLEDEKTRLTAQVADLETQKQTLEDDIAEKDKKVQELEGKIAELDEVVAQQREKIAKLTAPPTGPGGGTGQQKVAGVDLIKMSAGQKGEVVSVNSDWSYVVLRLDDKSLEEIEAMRAALAANNTPGFPTVELFLKRGNSYVSKVKLVQIKPEEKLAIADVLVDWQQAAVQPGDIAFF